MMREYRDYLEDILQAIDDTADFTTELSFEDFARDRKTVNAVIRSLEVLGEAAKSIPGDIRAQAPYIPWRRMAGMRDKLVHEYFGVDLGIVWSVIHEELPALRPYVKKLLTQLRQGMGEE